MFHLDCLGDPKKPRSNFWVILLIISLSFTIMWFLTGCVTQDKCNRKFPPQTIDSISTTTERTNCIDTIYTPGEPIIIEDKSPCPPNVEYHKEVKKHGVIVSIDISKGKIIFRCPQDSLMRIIEKQKETIRTNKSKTVVTPPVVIKETPFIAQLCEWFTGIVLLILLAFFGLKYVKAKFKW